MLVDDIALPALVFRGAPTKLASGAFCNPAYEICIGKTFSGKWSVHTAISSGSEMYTQLGAKQ